VYSRRQQVSRIKLARRRRARGKKGALNLARAFAKAAKRNCQNSVPGSARELRSARDKATTIALEIASYRSYELADIRIKISGS